MSNGPEDLIYSYGLSGAGRYKKGSVFWTPFCVPILLTCVRI
jgi:hypothetical protein